MPKKPKKFKFHKKQSVKIFSNFIYPLFKQYEVNDLGILEMVDLFFSPSLRSIESFVTIRSVSVKYNYVDDYKAIDAIVKIKKGAVVHLRYDARTPNRIDLEVCYLDKVFNLSKAQADALLDSLESVADKDAKEVTKS